MEDSAFLVENNEHGVSETPGIVQTLHQGSALCQFLFTLRLARIVIDMDILKIIRYDLADSSVLLDEVCELQTPGTPIATHLTDDELAFGLSFRYSLVYLLDGINTFAVKAKRTATRAKNIFSFICYLLDDF